MVLPRSTPHAFSSRLYHQGPTSQSIVTAASLCCAAADGDCAVSAARTKRMASAYTRSPALKMAGATDARSVASPFARSSAGHKMNLFRLSLLVVVDVLHCLKAVSGRWKVEAADAALDTMSSAHLSVDRQHLFAAVHWAHERPQNCNSPTM